MYTLRVVQRRSDDDKAPITHEIKLHDHELSSMPDIHGMVKETAADAIPVELPPNVTVENMIWITDWIRRKITVKSITEKEEFKQLAILADFLSMEHLLDDLATWYRANILSLENYKYELGVHWSLTVACANCEKECHATSKYTVEDQNMHYSESTGYHHLDHLQATCGKQCERALVVGYKGHNCEVRPIFGGLHTFVSAQDGTALAGELEVEEDFLFAVKYRLNGISAALEDLLIFQFEPTQRTERRKAFFARLKELAPRLACDLMYRLM